MESLHSLHSATILPTYRSFVTLLLVAGALICSTCVTCYAQVSQDFSNTTVENPNGSELNPLSLIDIKAANGSTAATLFITSKEAVFGSNQKLKKGAGVIAAKNGMSFRIGLALKDNRVGDTEGLYINILLPPKYVRWDDNGKATGIIVADRELKASTGETLRIKSELLDGLVHDGRLMLEIEEIGKVSGELLFGGYSGYTFMVVETDLTWAVCKGNLDGVRALIENKAQVNAKNGDGWSPLHRAAHLRRDDIIKLLLSRKAEINSGTDVGWTPLHITARAGHVDVVRLLLAHNADVNAKTTNKRNTPLLLAVWKGHVAVVEVLLSNGADVNLKDAEGRTPLYVAADWGHTEIVKLLLANKADVNAVTNTGKTLLQAVSKDQNEIVSLLREHGAQ